MARSGTSAFKTATRAVPGAFRPYLMRRSALELVILDALVVVGGLWLTLPGPVALDPFWTRVLLALAPGLMLVSRSLVIAVQVPNVFALAQLDPSVEAPAHPLLDEARDLTRLGLVLLAITIAGMALFLAVASLDLGV